jgi:hypothetical protein
VFLPFKSFGFGQKQRERENFSQRHLTLKWPQAKQMDDAFKECVGGKSGSHSLSQTKDKKKLSRGCGQMMSPLFFINFVKEMFAVFKTA